MNDTAATFDRRAEDIGNIVEFGHRNVCVPDQQQIGRASCRERVYSSV